MAQFDVYRLAGTSSLVVDCQADLLRALATRVVVPLVPRIEATAIASRLNPAFEMVGRTYIFMPQLATSVARTVLRNPVGSLAEHRSVLIAAIDILLTGI